MLKKLNFNILIIALMILSAIGTLTTVFIFEYLGVSPCILCLYQRVPYFIAGILGLLALFIKKHAKYLVLITAFGFFINIFIAGFNVGVERHWWEGTEQCEEQGVNTPTTIEEMQAVITGQKKETLARCDEIGWSLFDNKIITLAVLNVFGSLVLFLILTFGFIRWRKV